VSLDVLLVITHEKSDSIAVPLLDALKRKGVTTGVFVTGNGARVLAGSELQASLNGVAQAVACMDSWRHCYPEQDCPVTEGSQTDHSDMIGNAGKVLCL